jgi:hypothetical protein
LEIVPIGRRASGRLIDIDIGVYQSWYRRRSHQILTGANGGGVVGRAGEMDFDREEIFGLNIREFEEKAGTL